MAKPNIAQAIEEQLQDADSRIEQANTRLSELKKAHGDVESAKKELQEILDRISAATEKIEELEKVQHGLEEWITDFRDNKSQELVREFEQKRRDLQADIESLKTTKANEQEAIAGLIAAQEANDRRLKRQMEDALRQNEELGRKRDVLRVEIERHNQAMRSVAERRSVLNARAEALEKLESKLDRRENEIANAVNEARAAKRRADARHDALEKRATELNELQSRTTREREALNNERFMARNEMTRLKAEAGPLQEELAALRANIGALERRERLVAEKERRLKAKGIDLGA